MKIALLGYAVFFSAISFAKDTAPTNKNRKPNQASEFRIRCEGLKPKDIKVGIDFTFDGVERLTSLVSFEREATNPMDVTSLGAPSHFIKRDKNGKLVMFGFKTFNDGLEENISIFFIPGAADNSLQLSYLEKHKAIRNVSCQILK